MCVWVCLPPSTEKASSVWVWNSRGQINDVVLKTFLSSTKSFHRYFSMKHQAFLTSRFILFTHQKRTKPRLNVMCVSLSKIWDLQLQLSGIAFGPWANLLGVSALTRAVRKAQITTNFSIASSLDPVLGKVFQKICLFWSNIAVSLRQTLLVDALVETS